MVGCMKFGFLVHPLSQATGALSNFDAEGRLQAQWGVDPFRLAAGLHEEIARTRQRRRGEAEPAVSMLDDLGELKSPAGARASGRLYEIPLDARTILEEPDRALGFMEQAVAQAADWGARLVGLGSMTGVVGGRGEHLAEKSAIAVTTGNSLTVYTAVQNLFCAVDEFGIDLKEETLAVIGIPGSIASGVATLVAPHCGRLLLVGRNGGNGLARRLAEQLGAEIVPRIPDAVARARLVVSATSSGNCIDQRDLLPGAVVVDVGVPTDVIGSSLLRPDVLVLTGGLVGLPSTMSSPSRILRFQHGVIPSCLAETLVLALDGRPQCLSLGRNLSLHGIQEIGARARAHGLEFSRMYAFGNPLDEGACAEFRRIRWRMSARRSRGVSGLTALAPLAAARHARHCNPVLHAVGGASGFVKTFVRGEGAYLYDTDGRAYLDCVSGFGSLNLGHNHPAVARAVTEALGQHAPGFTQSAVNPYQAALAADLAAVAPPGLEMVFFCNSGTESVEAALKLARIVTGREALLSCESGYHGKSLGSLSVTGTPEYQRPFAPLVPGCEKIPYGDEDLLDRALATRRFAALIVEPLQAEGGMRAPHWGYLRAAQELCRRFGALLIIDEVQTGLGRTGALFACEHEGLEPDVLCLAKSLGGGLVPCGAMLTRRDLWMQAYGAVQTFALHTSTFGGGSLACAAGLATLQVLEQERLAENAAARGAQLLRGLGDLCRRFRCLREARGQGLLVGLEFAALPRNLSAHWRASDPTGLGAVMVPQYERMVEAFHVWHALSTLMNGHGIFAQTCRSAPRVLRLQPPLIVTEAEIERLLVALAQTCEEIDYSTGLLDEMVVKSVIGQHDAQTAYETRVPR
ncbi:MAG: aminotransferase class III-fold pyridoxal phosphate-dependent enzyme [Planctomycetaceae bacterium]